MNQQFPNVTGDKLQKVPQPKLLGFATQSFQVLDTNLSSKLNGDANISSRKWLQNCIYGTIRHFPDLHAVDEGHYSGCEGNIFRCGKTLFKWATKIIPRIEVFTTATAERRKQDDEPGRVLSINKGSGTTFLRTCGQEVSKGRSIPVNQGNEPTE